MSLSFTLIVLFFVATVALRLYEYFEKTKSSKKESSESAPPAPELSQRSPSGLEKYNEADEFPVSKILKKTPAVKIWKSTIDSRTVVVKKPLKDTCYEDFRIEILNHKQLPPHENVVQMLHSNLNSVPPFLVLEYEVNGSLDKLIAKWAEKPTLFDPKLCWKILIQTARGLLHMHNHGIIHRDLAPRNVLLTKDWNVKIADLGLSRNLTEADDNSTKSAVPIRYLAPECLVHARNTFRVVFSPETDVWSFACLTWEIWTQKQPYYWSSNLEEIREGVEAGAFSPSMNLDEHQKFPSALRMLMARCTAYYPTDRPNFAEIEQELVRLQRVCHPESDSSSNSLASYEELTFLLQTPIQSPNRSPAGSPLTLRTAPQTPSESRTPSPPAYSSPVPSKELNEFVLNSTPVRGRRASFSEQQSPIAHVHFADSPVRIDRRSPSPIRSRPGSRQSSLESDLPFFISTDFARSRSDLRNPRPPLKQSNESLRADFQEEGDFSPSQSRQRTSPSPRMFANLRNWESDPVLYRKADTFQAIEEDEEDYDWIGHSRHSSPAGKSTVEDVLGEGNGSEFEAISLHARLRRMSCDASIPTPTTRVRSTSWPVN